MRVAAREIGTAGQIGPDRVEVRDVTKVYRTRHGQHVALDRVSMDVAEGEFVVLLGPSGCGKTTLLRCIAGLEMPDSGQIRIDGEVVYCSKSGVFVPPERRNLNMVFQSYALWPHLSVIDNVAYPLRSLRVPRPEAKSRALETLDLVGLSQFAGKFPGQLSGGQQQRVALARALVSRDGLILFDEPLSNLDAKVRDKLRLELLSLQSRLGFSAVYVTHDQIEALALADRIAVMDVGSIAQVGTATDVYDRPVSHYVADFIGAANDLPGRVVGHEDGLLVETPVGRLKAKAVGREPEPGASVSVMIRPEHCQLTLLQKGGPVEPGNGFDGTIERSIHLGPMVQHIVRRGDATFAVNVSGGMVRQSGAEVRVTFPAERCRVYPK